MSQGKEAAAAQNRRRLLALFAAVGAVLIVLVTIALYSMHRLDGIVSANLARIDSLTATVDAARIAQVAFKTQVQEWKNTLLRGHDAQDFDRYRKAFLEQRKLVQERFGALAADAKVDIASALDLFESRAGFIAARGIEVSSIRFATAFSIGFDYYTGFEFRLHDPAGRVEQPLVAGGRYDDLLTRLGSKTQIPAVGLGAWVGRLTAYRGRA